MRRASKRMMPLKKFQRMATIFKHEYREAIMEENDEVTNRLYES
jgi:hypothetical protein